MSLKKYLPIEEHLLTSKLSVAEVTNRISENIDSTKTGIFYSFNNGTGKPFRGTIKDGYFKLTRIIRYRNSFLPVITGSVYKQFGETEIQIKMRLHSLVSVFITVWLGLTTIMCVGVFIAAIFNPGNSMPNGFSITLLIPFVMLIFGFLITFFSFKFETKKAMKLFKLILEAEEA